MNRNKLFNFVLLQKYTMSKVCIIWKALFCTMVTYKYFGNGFNCFFATHSLKLFANCNFLLQQFDVHVLTPFSSRTLLGSLIRDRVCCVAGEQFTSFDVQLYFDTDLD